MAENKNIYEKLKNIQKEIEVPKSRFNDFSNFYYRNCEDILNTVKPLLDREGLYLKLSDEIILIWERYYVKSTAKIIDENGSTEEVSTFAREEENKKGMDWAQITWASISYARKYALNGLFGIDDNDDPDNKDNTEKQWKKENKQDIQKWIKEEEKNLIINKIKETWKLQDNQWNIYSTAEEYKKQSFKMWVGISNKYVSEIQEALDNQNN